MSSRSRDPAAQASNPGDRHGASCESIRAPRWPRVRWTGGLARGVWAGIYELDSVGTLSLARGHVSRLVQERLDYLSSPLGVTAIGDDAACRLSRRAQLGLRRRVSRSRRMQVRNPTSSKRWWPRRTRRADVLMTLVYNHFGPKATICIEWRRHFHRKPCHAWGAGLQLRRTAAGVGVIY